MAKKIDGSTGVLDVVHLQDAMATVQANAEVLRNINGETISEVIKIHYRSMDNQTDLEREKIRSRSRQDTFTKTITITTLLLIFGFLFFSTVFFGQLGQFGMVEKILLFVFGFLGGAVGGGSGGYLLGRKNQRESQKKKE